jgi:hypothetical protein
MPGLDAATAPGPRPNHGPRPRPTGTRRSSSGPRARSRPRWAAPPTPRDPADVKAAARRAPSWAPFAAAAGSAQAGLVDRVSRAVLASPRAGRPSGGCGGRFSIFALVAFTVAFALAARAAAAPAATPWDRVLARPDGRPGLLASPLDHRPKRSTTTAAPSGSQGSGAFRGLSGGRVTVATTDRQGGDHHEQAQLGRRRSDTRPPATRPATTQPTTTQPTTTAPTTTARTTTAPPTTAGP